MIRLAQRVISYAFVALLSLGGVASLTQFATKHAATLGGFGITMLVVYATVVVALLYFVARDFEPRRRLSVACAILGVSLILKLAIVLCCHDLPQLADRLFLKQFVEQWESGGETALRSLSHEVFDYPLWTGRAWPVLYPMRVLFGEHHVFASQILNCFLSTALLASIYALARKLVRFPLVPLALAAVSPVFFWSVLDYGYQFQGALLITGTLLLFRRILRATSQPVSTATWIACSALGFLFFLLHLQQGLDIIVIALFAAASFLAAFASRSARVGWRLALLLIVIPVVISLPMNRAADSWFRSHDEAHLSSGLIGHMALGWNLETWGEFYGPVVALDKATPPERKNQVMFDYVVSQVRSRPFDALIKLPVIKLIKLFQLGAATGLEEAFEELGSPRWAALFKATRLVFAPLVLLLAALGSAKFFRDADTERLTWGMLVLGFVVAYTFFSETSPRYSFYFQFVLLACAAEGLAVIASRRARTNP